MKLGTPIEVSALFTGVNEEVSIKVPLSVGWQDLRRMSRARSPVGTDNSGGSSLPLGLILVADHFIAPGSPWETCYVESLTGKLRDKLLQPENHLHS